MKFVFPYEVLMKHRGLLEENARKEYLKAKGKSEEALGDIQKKEKSREEALSLLFKLEREKGKKAFEIQSVEEYLKVEEIWIKQKQESHKNLLEEEKEKKELFLASLKALRVLEILKERQKAKFEREKKKREMQDIEQIVIMGFKNK